MKKLIIAMMLASAAAFADTNVSANIQQLIDAKDWNTLATNNFDTIIVKTWQTADANALVDALIQSKQYFRAYTTANFNSSPDKLIDACAALAENNFVSQKNGAKMTIYWLNKFQSSEYRDTALSTASKLRQALAADVPAGIKFVNVFYMYDFIIHAEDIFKANVQPVQISDSMINNFANFKRSNGIVLSHYKLDKYMNQYAQIYAKYFAALPENSDLAIKQAGFWKKCTYFEYINKYYGNQFNDVFYAKSNLNGKIYIATQTGDADKLLDALENLTQDTLDAATAQKILVIFNGQKADWRAADVLKALKNINSMYTIKLYDDRDAWEPVLSKLRAMIEVRQ